MSEGSVLSKKSIPYLPGFGDEFQQKKLLRYSSGFALGLALLLHLLLGYTAQLGIFNLSVIDRKLIEEETIVEYFTEPEPKYVEANPNVPQNEPDETLNESFRSQQAAQENPLPDSVSDAPAIDGEFEDSQKIVQGAKEKEMNAPDLQAGLYGQSPEGEMEQGSQENVQNSVPQIQPVPLPDFIVQKSVSEEGPGSTLDEVGKAEELMEKAKDKRIININRVPNVKIIEEEVTKETAELALKQGVPVPLPRPKITFNVPTGPLMKRPHKTSRLGTTAIDSKLTEFGEYSQRMVEAVSEQWNILNARMTFASSEYKTMVALEFTLDRKGDVHNLEIIHSTASQTAILACQDAVLSRAPFGEWTSDMLARLGEETIIKFSFFYR